MTTSKKQVVRFAILGDSFVDVVAGTLSADQLPKWGSDVECSLPIQMQPGGSALNTATHLSHLGHKNPTHEFIVDLHTCVGQDSFSEVLKTHVSKRKIQLISPELKEVPTGVCIVLSGTNDRSFITHYGAARKFSIEHINEQMLLQANHLHIGGFYSCASLRGNLKPLLTKARAKGITISLDTNYDSSEKWSDLDTILPLVDIFMPNDVEALAISKKKNVDEALQFFSDKVLTLTVIKIGKQGAKAICSKTKQIWHHGSFEATFLDATGAGDSFNSGFLSAYKMSNGKNIYESLKWGCATASKIVANLGACGFEIDYQDVNEIITNSK